MFVYGNCVPTANSSGVHFSEVPGDCESSPESNSPDMLALCETNLDDSFDFSNVSVRGYLSLI